jgi:hypothetical protein
LGKIAVDSDEFRPLRYKKRWFCYLDLLGFTALVSDQNIKHVIPLYKKALSEIERAAAKKKSLGIIYSWFSDTFIIYSLRDREEDFAHVEQVGRLFFQSLILHNIPVRGAITHGSLYSQSSKNIFIGPALIDAYCYAENQGWIGFILTPNAHRRLEKSSIPCNLRTHYRPVDEPDIINHSPSAPIYAFAFNNGTVNGRNPYIAHLQTMRAAAPDSAKQKYDRTIRFLEMHSSENTGMQPNTGPPSFS